ncbi:MAG TPA: hypothetical protein VIP46_14575 [Pyrinomonadaceae bacterium]
MSEEPTENLSGRNTFEERVLAELANISGRLSSLETRMSSMEGRMSALEAKVDTLGEKVDARLRETRPIREAVLSRVEMIDGKLDILNHDMLEMRAEVNMLKRRQPPAA